MSELDFIEKQVLIGLLASVDNLKLFKSKGFTQEYFQFEEPRKLFVVISYHYDTHNAILLRPDFDSYMRRSTTMTPAYQAKLSVFYEELKISPSESTYSVLLDEFLLYYKNYQLSAALSRATSTLADKNPDVAMKSLQTSLSELRDKTAPETETGGFVGRASRDLVAIYEQKRDHPELFRGIDLGFPKLDRDLTHKPGTVTLIMGEMKSAKSILMLNIAHNLFSAGKRVYYHVNEGGEELVENRLIALDAGLNMTKLDRQLLNPVEFEAFKKSNAKLKGSNRLFLDAVSTTSSSAEYIENRVKKIQEAHGKVDAVLVDYLGLMQSSKPATSEWQRFGFISIELKDIAFRLNVPIIILCHVNRKGMQDKKKTYELEDMGLSLEPLKNVDVIMSWRIDDKQFFKDTNTGTGTLAIQGSRQSGQAIVTLDVDTTKMKIWEDSRRINFGSPLVTGPVQQAVGPAPIQPEGDTF